MPDDSKQQITQKVMLLLTLHNMYGKMLLITESNNDLRKCSLKEFRAGHNIAQENMAEKCGITHKRYYYIEKSSEKIKQKNDNNRKHSPIRHNNQKRLAGVFLCW